MFDPWVRKSPCRRKWQPTPVFFWKIPWTEEPGGLHGPWGCKSQTPLSDSTTRPYIKALGGDGRVNFL